MRLLSLERIAPILVLLAFAATTGFGRNEIVHQSGSLVEIVETVSENLIARDSEGFRVPTPGQLKAWKFIVESIYSGKPEDAQQTIKQLSFPYELKRFTERSNGREYFLLVEKRPYQAGWGAYVFDPKATSPVVIEAPHPKFDSNTEHQAIDAFLQTGASAFLLAGAHRRSNKQPSPCTQPASGDENAGYPVSDVAHAVDTPFHVVHETLVRVRPKTVAVQLHGMAERETCPNAFISNGSPGVTTNSGTLLSCLGSNGVEAEIYDRTTRCPLIALTNVQGRFSNGERTDPCKTGAGSSPEPGNFIHIEQEPAIRKDRASWQGVIKALKCAFPVGVEPTIPTERRSFVFESPGNPPIKVFYSQPPAINAKTELMVVMAGRQRNADEYLDSWIPWASKNNFVVLSPQFDDANWPEPLGYNFGNIASGREANNTPNARPKWAFTVIEQLFASARDRFKLKAEKYVLFGHSAGGQFVHRFMLFMPENKVRLAIAANPGFYTLPDAEVKFPYGLKNSPVAVSQKEIKNWTGSELILMRGTADIQRTESLRQTPEADAQGKNRFERAGFMFSQIKKADPATKWRLVDVPGVAHDQKGMAEAAQRLLDSMK